MRKALLIGLATIVGCSLLAGCGKKETKYTKRDVDLFHSSFGYTQNILVDKDTGVQYIFLTGYNVGALSVRLDADGKPMVDRSVRK